MPPANTQTLPQPRRTLPPPPPPRLSLTPHHIPTIDLAMSTAPFCITPPAPSHFALGDLTPTWSPSFCIWVSGPWRMPKTDRFWEHNLLNCSDFKGVLNREPAVGGGFRALITGYASGGDNTEGWNPTPSGGTIPWRSCAISYRVAQL